MPSTPPRSQPRSSRIGIGIDFGTTNSSVALFDGVKLRMLPLDPLASAPTVFPSALYLNREFYPRTGHRAIESYLEDNAGRRIQPEKEEVGGFLLSIGTMAGYFEDWVKVHAFTDANLPSRLFRSIKSWLGDGSLTAIDVFGRSLRVVALVTPILEEIRKQVERHADGPMEGPHVGRPIDYRGDPGANEVALQRMGEACGFAGFSEAVFYPEPLAASLSYLHRGRPEPGGTYLTFDFGGGTLDLCILRTVKNGFELEAARGVELGGDDIDRLIYRRAVFPELGEGALVSSRSVGDAGRVPFRFGEFAEGLLAWQHAHELNRNELRDLISFGLREGGETGRRLARLYRLISFNQSYRIFQAIEEAKIGLTKAEQAIIRVPELELSVVITRRMLHRYMAMEGMFSKIHEAIEELLASSASTAGDIDAVISTGGSSRLPPVLELLRSIFPGKLIEFDPFTGIAAGLAMANYHGYVPQEAGACRSGRGG